jgi:acetyl esterase
MRHAARQLRSWLIFDVGQDMRNRSQKLMLSSRLLSLVVVAFLTSPAIAQFTDKLGSRAPSTVDTATPEPTATRIYKDIDGTKLEIWIWKPADWKADDVRSAIIFYHGGSWRGGSPSAFARQSQRLARLGMVAFSVQYRLMSQTGITVYDCVKDAKSAFRWVVVHAQELGINPRRIAAGGSSSGGHLAAALATLDTINDSADNTRISTIPAALVLFAPALQLDARHAARAAGAHSPTEVVALSPFDHLRRGHPPTIIFHGEFDTTVPIRTAREYAAKVKDLGGQCAVIGFADQPHGFYHSEPFVWETLKQVEAFLREQQLLK